MNAVKKFLDQLFQDKNSNYAMREVIVLLCFLVVIISWIGQQFFHKDIPQFMFWSFVSLVGSGIFGYSLEKKALISDPPKEG